MPASRPYPYWGFSPLPMGFLALLLLGLSAGLGLLYSTVSIQELAALRNTIYARNEMPAFVLQVTVARYQLLQLSLLGTALGAVAGLVYLHRQRQLGLELRWLWQELKEAFTSTRLALRQLSRSEKVLGGLLLLAVEGLRVYYYFVYPLGTDEVATYDYFVTGGPVAITSFYPIPNNHILFSLSCWVVSWFTQNDLLILRLPTLVVSLLGTIAVYALLLRLTSFRVATLAVGLFCLSPLGEYYAVVGRGYFLLVVLAISQFYALLAVLHSPRYQRLGWAVFVVTGVLGMSTIPTYAYPLASMGLWASMVLVWRREFSQVVRLLVSGALMAGGTLLVYSPIICISGLESLTGNEYIAPQTLREFWQSYASYLQQPAWHLFGHEQRSDEAFLAGLLFSLVVAPFLPRPWRRVAAPALALVLLPFVFMPIQRVYAPARVLLYASFFFFVATALAGDWLLLRMRVSTRLVLVLTGCLLAVYGAYQAMLFDHNVRNEQYREVRLRSSYSWLKQHQAQRVFLQAPFHKLYFHHYALTQHYPLHLFEPASAQGTDYQYVVVATGQPPLPSWLSLSAYQAQYQDDWVTIYEAVTDKEVLRPPASQGASHRGK